MAITWGEVVGGYGKIGYEVTQTESNTKVTTTVKIYFASKYSVSDTSNTLYYDKTTTTSSAKTSQGAMSIKTTVDTGSGWSSNNQVHLKTFTHSDEAKTTSTQTRYFYAKLVNVDRVGGTMYVSGTYKIPALAKYTIKYNANGGSSTPSTQTKYYGTSITLAPAISRSGYTFSKWKANSTGALLNAKATYSTNASETFIAQWTPKTYTITYDVNGGTGTVASTTQTHDSTATLSSTIPTRTNYTFLGWTTTKTATTAQYSAGGSYSANQSVTLYAVWKLAYKAPSIYNFRAIRCDASGNEDESGTYALISCDYTCFYDTGAILTLGVGAVSAGYSATRHEISGTSGSFSYTVDGLLIETSYKISIIIEDGTDSTTATITLAGVIFPWDALAGGNGIAFGKNAEKEGIAEFAFDAVFNGNVSGNVMGLNVLPAIPAESDLNDYLKPGAYAVQSNTISMRIANIPINRAGRLEVYSATGEGIRDAQYSYLRQKFYAYSCAHGVWERDIARDGNNVWHYYDWWKSGLTPVAASQIYEKSALTIALSSNVTLGAVNTYTKIPFGKTAYSMGSKLSLSNGCVLIGANVDHVRVSGQTLVKCGSTAGNRHARIQKISGSTTTSIAWTCVYAAASNNTIFSLTPLVIPVAEGDLIQMVYYTGDTADSNQAGSAANGYQSYMTIETV